MKNKVRRKLREIDKLIEKINHAAHLYYKGHETVMDDYEYDELIKKLERMLEEYPEAKIDPKFNPLINVEPSKEWVEHYNKGKKDNEKLP